VRRTLDSLGLTHELSGKLVAVATSGGKDSLNTLFLLNKLKEEYDYDILAILIDEGISGYREFKRKALEAFCDKFKISFKVVSMRDSLGYDIDTVAKLSYEGKIDLKPCSVCGVFRRYLVNLEALKAGVDYIATGHNLDDEVQTFIMNFIRGDLASMVREGPFLHEDFPGFIPRFKPLYYVPEKESLIYFMLNGLETPYVECPYAPLSMRYYIRNLINRIEYASPGTKLRILSLKEHLRTIKGKVPSPSLRKCEICGMPTTRRVCRTCEIRMLLSRV